MTLPEKKPEIKAKTISPLLTEISIMLLLESMRY